MSTPTDTTPASNHPSTDQDTTTGQEASASFGGTRQLCRPIHDRMLGGVAAGIADYLGVDETIVRIVFVVLTFVGGVGIPAYLAGWLLIPEEGRDQSLAGEIIESLSQSLSARSN
jgi:phage shock protein PspC (stress-responsive transcriptional regulator)